MRTYRTTIRGVKSRESVAFAPRTCRFLMSRSRRLEQAAVRAAAYLRGRRVAADAVDEQGMEPIGELVGVLALPEPRVGPVRGREHEQGRGGVVEIRSKLAELAALAEERAEALLVPPPLGEELLAPRRRYEE